MKNINLKNVVFFIALLLGMTQLSYADGSSFTVNVPNGQGGYTAVVIQQSGQGYVGPQGEYYPQFPSVAQLQVVYGLGSPAAADTDAATVNITVPPPALPVYAQPDPPAPTYIWTPGYWAYDSFLGDYYWVPGTWIEPPSEGLLWTPGYWHWHNGFFIFSNGYWGHHVGFYGGVCYGHGYEGHGFEGGGWHHGVFVNRRVNITINNYSSFNGGPGGINARPTAEEKVAMKEKHVAPTSTQRRHMQAAMKNPSFRASVNHGRPAIAATVKPGVFKGKGIVEARKTGAFYNKTKPRAAAARPVSAAQHARPSAAQLHAKPRPKPKVKPKVKPKPKVETPPPPVDGQDHHSN